MRLLQESTDPLAVAAVEHFVYVMTKYVGTYASILGRLDALMFTAGVGARPLQCAPHCAANWRGWA
jgi:acetate kinase